MCDSIPDPQETDDYHKKNATDDLVGVKLLHKTPMGGVDANMARDTCFNAYNSSSVASGFSSDSDACEKRLESPSRSQRGSSQCSSARSPDRDVDSGSEYSSEGNTTISTHSGRHSRECKYSHKNRSQSRRREHSKKYHADGLREHRKKYYIDDAVHSSILGGGARYILVHSVGLGKTGRALNLNKRDADKHSAVVLWAKSIVGGKRSHKKHFEVDTDVE
jgi:hypothetical protein